MKKVRITIGTAGTIVWRLSKSCQSEYPLRAFPGWALRNPLYSDPDERFVNVNLLGKLSEDMILSTRGLGVCTEAQAGSESPTADAFAIVSEILRRLRYVSRQFSVPIAGVAMSSQAVTSDSPAISVDLTNLPETKVRSYCTATCLTEEHIKQVAEMNTDFTAPVHVDVLLDALEAHVQQDFRKALLYGAIAMDAFARHRLEVANAENIARADVRHRIISLPLPGGASVQKDPISELFLEADSFSRLLHEAPLYVLGRSLLVERPDTYQKARRLYTTRNKIAHKGIQPDDEKYFPATRAGSLEALRATADVFNWLGDAGPYMVWDGTFVSIGDETPMGDAG